MKYLLDFDHTLFDTDAFATDAYKQGLQEILITPRIWDYLTVADYLYNDTLSFLQSKPKEELIILTAFTPSLGLEAEGMQRGKFSQGDINDLVSDIIVMEGPKAPHVCPYAKNDEPVIFVDDSYAHHELVQATCPSVYSFQMIRPGIQKNIISQRDGIQVVCNMAEVNAKISSWNLR